MSSLPEFAMPEVLIGAEESAKTIAGYADWSDLVARIRSGQTDGMEELYQLFSRAIRFHLARQLGPDEQNDLVHETFVTVVQAIRRGELREPERLMGFVRIFVRSQAAAYIDQARRQRKRTMKSVRSSELRRENPDEAVAFHRRTELMDQVLATLSQRDREILTRFYLREQSPERICKEMDLTETQFRLVKSRNKARFAEMERKLLSHNRRHEVDPASETSTGASRPVAMEQILPVVAHAVAVFGDEQKASHWLSTPLPLLGNRSPSQLLERQEGMELVEQVLTRIEHNIPS